MSGMLMMYNNASVASSGRLVRLQSIFSLKYSCWWQVKASVWLEGFPWLKTYIYNYYHICQHFYLLLKQGDIWIICIILSHGPFLWIHGLFIFQVKIPKSQPVCSVITKGVGFGVNIHSVWHHNDDGSPCTWPRLPPQVFPHLHLAGPD